MAKPLITFLLLAYNQAHFIRAAIEGAFAQTYSPLEIILSDDRSSDNTFTIMQEMANNYRGPHKIILNRNHENLGIGAHINRIIQICSGQLTVVAAGDDISYPERTQRIFEVYESTNGRAKSIFSNSLIIDAAGKTQTVHFKIPRQKESFLLERIIEGNFILTGCSHAWSRDVFDVFGPLLIPLNCEDMVIPFRSALLGDIIYIDDILIKYRRHEENTFQMGSHNLLRRARFSAGEDVAIFRNWLKDLNRFVDVRPSEANRIAFFRKRISERLKLANQDILLFNSSWLKRAIVLITNLFNGMPLRTVKHRIGIFLIPQLYQKYLQLKQRQVFFKDWKKS